MLCDICSLDFDLDTRAPLVLQCGHTFCKTCVSQLLESAKRLKCPADGKLDARPVAELPRDFALVDASKLDLEAAALLRGVNADREFWLDGTKLELSETEIGTGASGRVVDGLYQEKPVSTAGTVCCVQ